MAATTTFPCLSSMMRGASARSPVRDRVTVGVFGRADLEGQVDDSVSVRGDPLAQRGARPDGPVENEPRAHRDSRTYAASSGDPVSGPRYATRRMPNAVE